jgi:hypothetical protein
MLFQEFSIRFIKQHHFRRQQEDSKAVDLAMAKKSPAEAIIGNEKEEKKQKRFHNRKLREARRAAAG